MGKGVLLDACFSFDLSAHVNILSGQCSSCANRTRGEYEWLLLCLFIVFRHFQHSRRIRLIGLSVEGLRWLINIFITGNTSRFPVYGKGRTCTNFFIITPWFIGWWIFREKKIIFYFSRLRDWILIPLFKWNGKHMNECLLY